MYLVRYWDCTVYTRYLDRDMVAILAFILAAILDLWRHHAVLRDLYYTENKIEIGPQLFKISF